MHRGVIESPNFPTKYPNNLQCDWTILAPPGNKVLIAFSQFEIEENYEERSNECSYDYLEIVQKKSDDKEISISEKFCREMPKEFTSIGDIVLIK